MEDNTTNTNNIDNNSNVESDLSNAISSSGIEVPLTQEVHINENTSNNNVNKVDIDEMNALFGLKQRIYEKVLSPQLKKNEKLKRTHKSVLMSNIFKLLKWQFIFTYVFVSILLVSVIFSSFLSLDTQVINAIIKFIKFYITSIVVELISILFFIVQNVFDKSIVDLFSNFDNSKKNRKGQSE